MQTDSELESDTSSINEGITGSSLNSSSILNPSGHVSLAGLLSGATAPGGATAATPGLNSLPLEKRVETLVQENRVLKMEIETYKLRVKSLQEENKELRKASVNIQARAEQEEEYISNKLLKKIQLLKKEKETLANNYEREEEFLTNDLSRKLNQLRNEKVQLEQTLEQEQEQMVNKLMRKIDKLEAETSAKQSNLEQLRREKIELENTLEQEQESLVNRLWKRMERLESEKRMLQEKLESGSLNNSSNSVSSSSSGQPPMMVTAGAGSILTTSSNPASAVLLNMVGLSGNAGAVGGLGTSTDQATSLTEHIINLRREVSRLKANLEKGEREHRENISRIVREEKLIKEENLRLQRRLQMEVDRREALCRHLSESESSLEMDDERHFNESTRVRTISSPVPAAVAAAAAAAGSSVDRCPTCNQPRPVPQLAQSLSTSATTAPMAINHPSPPGSMIGSMHHHHHAPLAPPSQHSMSTTPVNIHPIGAGIVRQTSQNMLNASSSLSSSSSSLNSSNRVAPSSAATHPTAVPGSFSNDMLVNKK